MAVDRAVTVLQAIALTAVVKRLLPGARRKPPLAPPPPEIRSAPPVSIIIPARNEADRIAPCLTSLQRAGVDEVIVVDDESTDDTAAVARDLGAMVISGAPLPDGWVGKPWALHQGLTAARNEIVVCLDADTIVRADLFPALVQELDAYDFVTVSPRFLTSSTPEQALHASMLNGLVYRMGAVGMKTPADPSRIYGNGQCFAFRRSLLVREGGFALVSDQMNDDIALLRALSSRGVRISFRDGRELLDVRMYASTREVWTEWGRSLPMVDITPAGTRGRDIAMLWLTLVVPWLRIARGRGGWVDFASLAMRVGMTAAVAPSYEGKRVGVWLSPLMDAAATLRLTQATLDPVRAWRGRRYTPPGSEARRRS
jgi:dolichol-phosphate mannosyltransferase